MSSPSSRTRPVIQPPSTSSCIRFRVLRKVDLPQPDGPIRACTWWARKPSETLFTAVNLPYIAVSLSVSTRTAAGVAVAGGGGAVRRAASTIERKPAADGEPRAQAEHEHDQDEDEGGGPGELVPYLVGTGGVGEHRQRQRRHRLVEVEAHVLAAERREEQGGGLAGDAGDRQEAAGHDARQGGPHD